MSKSCSSAELTVSVHGATISGATNSTNGEFLIYNPLGRTCEILQHSKKQM